jgi:hypothetical protein
MFPARAGSTNASFMNAFLELDLVDRQLSCKAVQTSMRLDAASVEKDLWVCWTLRELFSLPGIAEHLTFKGGTSLSKAWKLIHRFSEDIDLIVDKEALGFGGDAAPDKAASNKPTRSPHGRKPPMGARHIATRSR